MMANKTVTDEQKTNVERLLESIRDSFVAELPERCDDLEQLVLALGKMQSFAAAFEEVYRKVHSLKGSAGTHGLGMLTLISHQFEDLLSTLDQDFAKVNDAIIDTSLRYVDLLRECSLAAADGRRVDAHRVNDTLEKLKFSIFPGEFSCLIVENSKMLARVAQHAIEGLPVAVSIVDNGVAALERLLHEKFDILITSKELPSLNGVALISAVRYSEGVNRDVFTLLLTSKPTFNPPNPGMIDVVLHKDGQLASNLMGIVREQIRGLRKAAT